jgi:hypothetical protein
MFLGARKKTAPKRRAQVFRHKGRERLSQNAAKQLARTLNASPEQREKMLALAEKGLLTTRIAKLLCSKWGRVTPRQANVVVRRGTSYPSDDKFVSFGSVTIHGLPAEDAELSRRNLESGQQALERAGNAFVRAGVKLPLDRSVPRFHVDPNHPGILLRELDGRTEPVSLSDGTFKVTR